MPEVSIEPRLPPCPARLIPPPLAWLMLCLLSLPPSSASLPARTPRNSLSLGICGLLLEQSVPLQAGIPGQSWQEQFARSAGKADCCHPKAADIPDPWHSVIL